MKQLSLSPPAKSGIREYSLSKYVLKTNNQKLMNNFGRREELIDEENCDQEPSFHGTKRAISEPRAQNGNYIGNTGELLKAPNYINDEIEKELITFKKEIEAKFANSRMNQTYNFPRIADAKNMKNYKLGVHVKDQKSIKASSKTEIIGYVSPRSLSRDKSPIKMFCKRLYDKPMNMIYHSQVKNKTITAYKPISGSIRKAKGRLKNKTLSKSSKRNKSMIKNSFKSKDDLNVSDMCKNKLIFNTVSSSINRQNTSQTPEDLDDLQQNASYSTFYLMKKNLFSQAPIGNTTANILKYKKYIKPFSPSPINALVSEKLSKRAKTGSEVQRLQNKIEESFKTAKSKNHGLSMDFTGNPSSLSFKNSSITDIK